MTCLIVTLHSNPNLIAHMTPQSDLEDKELQCSILMRSLTNYEHKKQAKAIETKPIQYKTPSKVRVNLSCI
jgi:hypothetical protein